VAEIYVDGDACPVKEEVIRVASRYRLTVHLVSNRGLRSGAAACVHPVVVGSGPDAADDWIAEHIRPGDIAVTTDIRLAARCLAKGAHVLAPSGKPFTDDSIGMAVAMRDLMAHLRDVGDIKGNNAAFSRHDRSRFLQRLDQTIRTTCRSR
jgi:uncharacterized protein YaiI (UPF0178 family)